MRFLRSNRESRPAALALILAALGIFALLMTTIAEGHHHHQKSEQGQSGRFDYYLLSLSWAPTYCLTHSDDSSECSSKGYGFVLHGLWPQYDGGGYPDRCVTGLDLTSDAAAKGRTLYPSERLMSHEWQEHGTCSGMTALDYFRTADQATAAVKIPAELETPQSDQSFTADQIISLFQHANPRLPEGGMTVACNRANLSEVRICLTRELAVRACGPGVHTSCPKVALQLPAAR